MNNSKSFLLIYKELRDALGPEVMDEEVLACAQLIQQTALDTAPVDYSFRDPRQAAETAPVYDVFEKMGWRLAAQDESQWEKDWGRPSANDYFLNELGLGELKVCA